MKATINETSIILEIPRCAPTPSKSGKTFIVGSSHGAVTTTVQVDGKPVVFSGNLYIKP